MSSTLFSYRCPCCTLLLVTMVTVFACFVTGQPDKEKKRSNPVISFLRSQRLKSKALFGCGVEEDPCIPGTNQCCDGYECRTKFAHICLYPLEACVCTSPVLGYLKAGVGYKLQ